MTTKLDYKCKFTSGELLSTQAHFVQPVSRFGMLKGAYHSY